MLDRSYCSVRARESREPLGGTASHAHGCVLLSYPKRLWGRDVSSAHGIGDALREELARLHDDHGVVTRMIAPVGVWERRVEVCFFPQARRIRDVPLDEVAALLARGDAGVGETIDVPIVAVCTHGQRDRCCAIAGLAIHAELAREARGRIEVREASHLGGDRFAPVVLALPSGHMYGHVERSDVPALIEGIVHGPPLRSRFRGSLWLDPRRQLAEIAMLDLAPRGIAPRLGAIAEHELDPDHAELDAEILWGAEERTHLRVRITRERRPVHGDCRSIAIDRRGSVEAWAIESVTSTRASADR